MCYKDAHASVPYPIQRCAGGCSAKVAVARPAVTQSWYLRTVALAFLIVTALQAIRPMVSYRALQLGGTAVDLGVIAGSYALLAVLFAVPVGRWVDRVGEARLLLFGTLVGGAIAIWLAGIESISALAASQAILGLGHLSSIVGLQTLLANAGPSHGRDGRFGALTVVTSLGQMAGPGIVGWLGGSGGSARLVFLTAAALFVVSVVLAVTLWLSPPAEHEGRDTTDIRPRRSRDAIGTVMRSPSVPSAILASMAVVASVDIVIAYLPAYGEARGLTVATVTLLLSARAGAALVSRVLMMPMIRAFGRRRLLGLSTLLPAVTLAAIPLTASPPVLFVLICLAGFGLGLGQPLTVAWVTAQVPVLVRGTAIGLRLTGNRLGQLAVPVGVGLLAGATGLAAVFVSISVWLGGSAITVLRSRFDDASFAPPTPPPERA